MLTAARNIIFERVTEKKSTSPGSVPIEKQQRETAQYIADMILELRNMAKSAQLYQVMVPLEYSYYEAFSAANKVEIPPEEAERLRELSRVAAELETIPEDY